MKDNILLESMPNLTYVFKNKRILIATSGSIAIYKICELISLLKKYGAEIRVVMSAESSTFIAPLTFEALSGNVVLCENNQSWHNQRTIENGAIEDGANHISYAKWADVLLIAPASANSIAKISYGIADNIMLSTILACKAPKLLAPAMNTAMLQSSQTKDNLKRLKTLGFEIIESRINTLVCGDVGNGAMASLNEIIFKLAKALMRDRFWQDKAVIITGGGSKEPIDAVRYISNHSSGKQALSLAIALYALGARVKLISSCFPYSVPLEVVCESASSVAEFKNALDSSIKNAKHKPIIFMAAALADFSPAPQKGKIKKEQVGKVLRLECARAIDVLSHIKLESAFKIGFKAECDSKSALESAKAMLDSKNCNMVCLNVIDSTNAFGSDNNNISIITKEGTKRVSGDKLSISFAIARAFKQLKLC